GPQTVALDGGSDTVTFDVASHSTVIGGLGNDSISFPDTTVASVLGGSGRDTIKTGTGDYTVSAGNGNDLIKDHGRGLFHANAGNDTVTGFNLTGATTVYGDTGTDSIAV